MIGSQRKKEETHSRKGSEENMAVNGGVSEDRNK
jgi:hypothetical protein